METTPLNINRLQMQRELGAKPGLINSQMKQQMLKKTEDSVKEIRILLSQLDVTAGLVKLDEVETLLNEFKPEEKTRLLSQMMRISFAKLERTDTESGKQIVEQIRNLIQRMPKTQERDTWEMHLDRIISLRQ